VHALKTLNKEVLSKHEMALSAINIEQNIIRENVGSQDQIAAAYGGFNQINFYQNEKIEVSKILFPENKEKELNNHLMLFFTGITRMASEIAEVQINNIKTKKTELQEMNEMVDEGIKILNSSTLPLEDFGKLLHKSWQIKKTLSPIISNQAIDEIYSEAMKNGAIGGKILGAGGGGFILFFVKPENQQNFKNKFNKLVHVPFSFENTGSKVIFYDPENFYNEAG
jgi:D-glycero-alpha-D-manno-heptose-7-phosphate kinase